MDNVEKELILSDAIRCLRTLLEVMDVSIELRDWAYAVALNLERVKKGE